MTKRKISPALRRTRAIAKRAARVAAYGSPTERTPADYSWLEAIQAMPARNDVETPDKAARKQKTK